MSASLAFALPLLIPPHSSHTHFQKSNATRTETQRLKQEIDVVGVEAIKNETGDLRN
jgi:hypothetical protein